MTRSGHRWARGHHRDDARTADEEQRAGLAVAVVSGAIALAAVIAGSLYGDVRPRGPGNHVAAVAVAWTSAAVFTVAGVVATRRAASVLGRFMAVRTIKAAGAAVRLLATVTGYVVVLFTALGLLSVSIGHILTAGALTGVVIGIAAQQSLGNVFAGMVLLLARPFTIGDHIRVRSGALGGLFDGVVLGMSLTYVTMSTEDGLLKVPNSALLAAAVGPFRARAAHAGTTGQHPVVPPATGPVPAAAPVEVARESLDPRGGAGSLPAESGRRATGEPPPG